MEKDICVNIPPKKFRIFLIALLFLIVAAVFIALPILVMILPIEGATEAQRLEGRAYCTILMLFVAVPCLVVSADLFMRLSKKYILQTDEEGLSIYTGFFSLGRLPWSCISEVQYRKGYFFGLYCRTLILVLNDEKVFLNIFYKLHVKTSRKDCPRRIYVPLSFCRGNRQQIADSIIAAWQQVKAQSNNSSDTETTAA